MGRKSWAEIKSRLTPEVREAIETGARELSRELVQHAEPPCVNDAMQLPKSGSETEEAQWWFDHREETAVGWRKPSSRAGPRISQP